MSKGEEAGEVSTLKQISWKLGPRSNDIDKKWKHGMGTIA